MLRPLGSSETALALVHERAPFAAVGAIGLAGPVTATALTDALAVIRERHPLLRATIAGTRAFRPDSAPPIRVGTATGEWTGVVEEQLNSRFDTEAGPLMRCALVQDRLVVAFHHSIVDGVSGTRVLHEVLTVAGGDDLPAVSDRSIPPRAEDLFPAGSTGLRRLLPFVARQLAAERGLVRQPGGTPSGRTSFEPLVTPADTTTAIQRRARRERVGLNAALAAAVLVAGGATSGRHRAITFADLRPYLSPAPADTTLACYIAMLAVTIDMPPGDAWACARDLQAAVYSSARRGEKFLAAASAGRMIAMSTRLRRPLRASSALSFGPSGLRGSYGPIEVRGAHAAVTSAGTIVEPRVAAVVMLMDGRLHWGVTRDAADPPRKDELGDVLETMAG